MEKIKIIADSACDIPYELEKNLNIDIIPIPINIDGVDYLERVDHNFTEFYEALINAKSLPVTAHITAYTFFEKYKEAFEDGCTDIIVVTINSKGSNTFNAANMAKEQFFDEFSDAEQSINITVIDSKSYSMIFGQGVVEGARLIKEGKPACEVIARINKFYDKVHALITIANLDFAKKSGRITTVAAFVGEMLGIRPLLLLKDNEIKTIDKARGEKAVIEKLIAQLKARNYNSAKPLFIIRGKDEPRIELYKEAFVKEFGNITMVEYYVGASVAINIGPYVIAPFFEED